MKERKKYVSRPLVVLHSSQRDKERSNSDFQEPAEVQRFCGFFFSELLRFRLGGTKDMVTLLSKLWIKSDNYKDSKVREKYGVLCGAVGIFLNVLLFLGKFFAGLLFGGYLDHGGCVQQFIRCRKLVYIYDRF